MTKPYYDDGRGIVIYHGDCIYMSYIASGGTVVTDPPYGLGLGKENNLNKNGGYGGHLAKGPYLSYEDSYQNFTELIVPRLTVFIKAASCATVFTGPHIHEQMKPCAIGGVFFPAATGRTPWGSKNFLPILFYGTPPQAGQHRPTVIRSTATSGNTEHPCAKPLAWMKWLVSLSSVEGGLIIDPFMGSGTTLRAAKDLGRKAIGVEIEERYCEIAAKRLSQEVFEFAEVSA